MTYATITRITRAFQTLAGFTVIVWVFTGWETASSAALIVMAILGGLTWPLAYYTDDVCDNPGCECDCEDRKERGE